MVFLQLFHCVGKIDVTLRNTGKVGFNFSIKSLQREEEEAEAKAGKESGAQTKALQPDSQLPDVQEKNENEKQEKEQVVVPDLPMVIPAVVS